MASIRCWPASTARLMAPTPLTLAETASVFGEMLTFRSMLATTPDPVERKAMLATKVEDMLNTVVRQIAFYKFERARSPRATQRRIDDRTNQPVVDGHAIGKPRTRDCA